MKLVRIFSSDDGETHLEDLTLPLAPQTIAPGVPPLDLSQPLPAQSAIFVSVPGESRDEAWHNAPARQLIFYLAGQVVLEAHDGSSRALGPGSVVLAEDTAGAGHRYRNDGEPMLLAFVPLRD